MTNTPIFEQTQADHGFDPLEHVEYETIRAWDGRAVTTFATWQETSPEALEPYHRALAAVAQELARRYTWEWLNPRKEITITVPGFGEISGTYRQKSATELFIARLKAPQWPPMKTLATEARP